MGITIKTVNGDQVNEIKFDDCSYALKVFPLLTVLKYKIKDSYKEADVVCYYDGQSKLIQNERESSFPDGSTLIITFKRQVATNYVSTDDLDAQEYEIVSEKEDNAQKSVNVPVVVSDAIRKQVDKMDTFLKKVASEQHVNEEKYCKMELPKLIDAEEANDVCDPKEKALEISHCFEVYKRYKTLYYETKGQQINFSFEDYLDYILKNTDHQPIKVCSQAFVHLSQDYDTVTIDLVTTPGEFPTNHQLSVSTSNSNLFTINLSGFFPNTGGTKKFRYFPVTEDIKSKPLSVAISDKTTGRITMKGKSEGNSLPKLIRLSTVVDKIESSIDLDSIQEQTSKLYDEISKYETANKETSIISEDESAIKTESANWEEYDFLSDSSV